MSWCNSPSPLCSLCYLGYYLLREGWIDICVMYHREFSSNDSGAITKGKIKSNVHRNHSLTTEMQVSWEDKWHQFPLQHSWFGQEGKILVEIGGDIWGRRIYS